MTPTPGGWAAKVVPLLILAGLFAYANSFTKVFLLDDDYWIVNNPKLAGDPVTALQGVGRPLAMATIVANYRFGGLKPFGYHLVNVAIHLAAALALYGFVRRTLLLPRWAGRFDTTAVPIAFAVALLWMLHPLQTQSVTYIIQRCESMMGLFFLVGFYAFARAATANRPSWWYVAAIVAVVLSAGCKETAAVFPPLVLLYDRAFVAGTLGGALRQRKWFYLALLVVWGLLVWTVAGAALVGVLGDRPEGRTDVDLGFGIRAFGPYQYLLTQAGVIVHYLRLSVWPTGQCFDYQGWPIAQSPTDVMWQLAVVVGLLVAALWAAVWRPAAGFVALWFFATLAPTSSVMPIIDVAFEQRMYLPLAALVVFAVVGGAMLVERFAARAERPGIVWLAARIVVATVAIALGVRTAARNEVYRSSPAMWEDVVQKNPAGFRPRTNLAQAYLAVGRFEDGVRAADAAIERDPTAWVPYVNKGSGLVNLGKLAEGQAALQQAWEVANRAYPVAENNLAWCHVWAGRYADAEPLFRKASQGSPLRPEYRFNHAIVLFLLKRDAEAQAQADVGRRLNPEWLATRARVNRIVVLAEDTKLHDLRSAVLLQELICRLDGDRSPEYLDTLAFAYAAEGRFADAAAATRRALAAAGQAPEWQAPLRDRLTAYTAGRPVRPAAKKP